MTIRLLAGDCRDVLATLPDASVHTVVTSPPYYGLRDYQTASWEGGRADCDHKPPPREVLPPATIRNATFRNNATTYLHQNSPGRVCRCGATRVDRQIGLEHSPEAYLQTMVQVFRQIRRVLRPDGTCWVNIGDSYASGTKGSGGVSHSPNFHATTESGRSAGGVVPAQRFEPRKFGMGDAKPKDLLLMPARLALALQADGWWVRSDIIWHKPNPMPESCTDRPTSAHEHVFLLTRSGTPTFWTHRDHAGTRTSPPPDYRWAHAKTGEERDTAPDGWDEDEPTRKLWKRINLWRGYEYFYDADAVRETSITNDPRRPYTSEGAKQLDGRAEWHSGERRDGDDFTSRNLRNVWTIATHAYSAAHFATFPPELASRCIRAGTSERGCCAQCGAPWVRTQETVRPSSWEARKAVGHPTSGYHAADGPIASRAQVEDNKPGGLGWVAEKRTTGWSPSCTHNAAVVPATVLDPFFGAGTTGLVSDRLGRDCIGIDLNPDYNAMSRARITADAPLFAAFPVADPAEERQAELWAEPLAAD